MRKAPRPDVGAVGPKLERVSGVKPVLFSKIADLIKPNGGLVTPVPVPTRRIDKILAGASRGAS